MKKQKGRTIDLTGTQEADEAELILEYAKNKLSRYKGKDCLLFERGTGRMTERIEGIHSM